MKRVALVMLAVLAFPLLQPTRPAAAEASEPIKAGKIAARYFPSGLGYAVYAPKTWRRRKPTALVIHVAMPAQVPLARMRSCVLPKEADQAARDGFTALHAMVLAEAPNKENTLSRPQIDRERYLVLLEKDVAHVDAVIQAIAAEVPIRRDAVFIRGWRHSGEAALGIAMRQPETFAGAMSIDMLYSTIGWADDTFQLPWSILPEGEARGRACGLRIFVTNLKGMSGTEEKARKVGLIRDLLKGQGFDHVETVARNEDSDAGYFMTPEGWAWLRRVSEARALEAQQRDARDALLADGSRQLEKGRLSPAVRIYAKAKAIEAEANLTSASQALYERLVDKGREQLREADALSAAKRRAAYRTMARLFAGTPFGDEVTRAQEALR